MCYRKCNVVLRYVVISVKICEVLPYVLCHINTHIYSYIKLCYNMSRYVMLD